jgi:hypothetical protein
MFVPSGLDGEFDGEHAILQRIAAAFVEALDFPPNSHPPSGVPEKRQKNLIHPCC